MGDEMRGKDSWGEFCVRLVEYKKELRLAPTRCVLPFTVLATQRDQVDQVDLVNLVNLGPGSRWTKWARRTKVTTK